MKKILLVLFLLVLFLPSFSYGQTDEAISDLPSLSAPPEGSDLVVIVDLDEPVTANKTKKSTVSNLLGSIGGGGDLGDDLSSIGDNIFSTTGSVTFDGMAVYAEQFISTGTLPTVFTDVEVLNDLIIPSYQDCSTMLQPGGVCIDGNISGLVDALCYIGSDGFERCAVAMLKSDIVSINNLDSVFFDADNSTWTTLPANIPLIGGLEGTAVYPLTPATTDLFIGGSTSGTADTWLKYTGGSIFNQNNADTHFNIQGTTNDNLMYTDGDQVSFGTNTPAVGALVTVQGTLSVTGTLIGAIEFNNLASADPCSGAGTGEINNNAFFFKTGGVPCYCDASGVDKKLVDDSSCF